MHFKPAPETYICRFVMPQIHSRKLRLNIICISFLHPPKARFLHEASANVMTNKTTGSNGVLPSVFMRPANICARSINSDLLSSKACSLHTSAFIHASFNIPMFLYDQMVSSVSWICLHALDFGFRARPVLWLCCTTGLSRRERKKKSVRWEHLQINEHGAETQSHMLLKYLCTLTRYQLAREHRFSFTG